jgi:quinol monooxygenase YgiN
MTIAPLVNLHLLAATRDEAVDRLHASLVDTRGFDGCLGIDVLCDPDDPRHVLLYERWESHAHYDAYREWRRGDGVAGQMHAYVDRPIEVDYWELIDG